MDLDLTIRSGGQSGVDRAALDAALALGLRVAGWCPAGRWAEDGPIPPRYPLRETAASAPEVRTRLNVRDADATLILSPQPLAGGTERTRAEAERLGRPVLVVDPFHEGAVPEAVAFVASHLASGPLDLNVAGPRESEAPGMYAASRAVLSQVFDRLEAGRLGAGYSSR
ncbi:MAG: putative molybdenum carrier protein [Bacteroidota bacterium]